MYTRQNYLNKKCTHREYYAQYVEPQTKAYVKNMLGEKRILNSNSENFSDIELSKWDSMTLYLPASNIVKLMKERGDYLTQAGLVCIFKEAARQIKEELLKD